MNRQITRLLNRLFIVSSYRNQTVSPAQLVQLANQAFFARDYDSLITIAHGLMELSPRTETAGQYFKALAICRDGASGREEAHRIFEELTGQPNMLLRSLALGGLALEGIFHQETPACLSQRLIIQASRLAYHSRAYVPFLQSQNELSLFHSLNGDHKTALELLQGVSKLMDSVKKVYPALYFNYLNNLSYELAAIGEVAAAQYYNRRAMLSPYAARYPEWHETEREIREKLRQPSSAQIFVPEATAQAYEYCFENVYRLQAFYEFPAAARQLSLTTPQTETLSEDVPAEKSNVHYFPSPEVLAAPCRDGEGVFEVRFLYQRHRRSLYVIPELSAAPYADWFTYLDQLVPSPDSPFTLEIAFNNGVREFVFTSKPIAKAVIENLKPPTRMLADGASATADSRPSAMELLKVAKLLLAMVEENFKTSPASQP